MGDHPVPAVSRNRLMRFLLPARSERRHLVYRLAFTAVILAYLALALAHLTPFDFRTTAPARSALMLAAFMARTFQFHAGVALLVIAAVACVARRARLCVTTLPLVLFTLAPAAMSYLPRTPPAVPGETAKVMSVNLLAFNLATGPITSEIAVEDPDVLLLEEYTLHWDEALADVRARYAYVVTEPRADCFGTAIYSKRPFLEPPRTNLTFGAFELPQIRAVIALNGRPTAFYCVHLIPPASFGCAIEQRRELGDLVDHLKHERLPIVLCGDFNFTADSVYQDALERLGLADAHDLAGRGRGDTWPVNHWLRYVPGIRLDHVFLSPELTALRSGRGQGLGSDHRPVMAVVGYR